MTTENEKAAEALEAMAAGIRNHKLTGAKHDARRAGVGRRRREG